MPGGNKNIKPEDGKQFSYTYQPKKKWTKKKAKELGIELIEWLNEVDESGKDKGNTLFEEFLVIKKGLYPELISYLKKYSSFLKLYNIAKKTQEIKISKGGIGDTMNPSMCKFLLSATHGLKERKDVTTDDEPIKSNIVVMDKNTKEALSNMIDEND